MSDEMRKHQKRSRALGFLPFRNWMLCWLEAAVATICSPAGGKPAVLALPSPFPDENTAELGTPAPRAKRRTAARRCWLWEWTGAVGLSGLVFAFSWQARHSNPDLTDTVHALQEQVAAQTRQLQTHTQQLDLHAIQLLAQTQRLDTATHDIARHTQQLNAHADRITLHTQRLDAHAEEFVLRIAQLETHADQLDTHAHQLARQARTRTTRRAQPVSALPALQNGYPSTQPGAPPILEAFAPLHGRAAAPHEGTSASAAQPAAPHPVITLPADLGAVALRGGSRTRHEREQP